MSWENVPREQSYHVADLLDLKSESAFEWFRAPDLTSLSLCFLMFKMLVIAGLVGLTFSESITITSGHRIMESTTVLGVKKLVSVFTESLLLLLPLLVSDCSARQCLVVCPFTLPLHYCSVLPELLEFWNLLYRQEPNMLNSSFGCNFLSLGGDFFFFLHPNFYL